MKYLLTTDIYCALWHLAIKNRMLLSNRPQSECSSSALPCKKNLPKRPTAGKCSTSPVLISLLFATPTKAEKRSDSRYVEKLLNQGFGGFYFLMTFNKDNTVAIQADTHSETLQTVKTSEYTL